MSFLVLVFVGLPLVLGLGMLLSALRVRGERTPLRDNGLRRGGHDCGQP